MGYNVQIKYMSILQKETRDADLQLSEQLSRLSKAVEKSNSFRRAFLMGIARSVGAMFGAIIIAAIIVAIVGKLAQNAGIFDLIKSFSGGLSGNGASVQNLMQDKSIQNIMQEMIKNQGKN